MTMPSIVIVEKDPLVAEDIQASLQDRFPEADCRIYTLFEEARAYLLGGAPVLLAVIASGGQRAMEINPGDFLRLQSASMVLIDANPGDLEPGTGAWQFLSKPFSHDMLIAAACAAIVRPRRTTEG